MRLTALDLTGFKSFARHAHLEFREGITAIVGPNGSGKSNIADAIRWVFGEQSMKTLRGKKSEDVIFSGSSSRGRVGMAEVLLTLSNDEGGGPIDAAEITITRQLTRSGESTYLVNNRPVRLLDVAEILTRAGFGHKTYTVIGQGMTDEFVNASPTERRAMFEDATGVTPLLLKKEQAERKLEQTKEHLLRARDLLRELEPRLRSLKRSAARARSREQLEGELRAAEAAWCAHLWGSYTHTLTEAETTLRTIDERRKVLSQQIGELRGKEFPTADASRLPRLRQEIDTLREEEEKVLVALARQGGTTDEAVDRTAEERHSREKEIEKITALAQEARGSAEEKERLLRGVRESVRALQEKLLAIETAPLGGPRAGELRADLEEAFTRQEALSEHLSTVEDLEDLPAFQEEADHIKVLLENLLHRLDAAEDLPGALPATPKLREQFEEKSGERDVLEKDVTEARVRLATLEAQLRGAEERLQELRGKGPGTLGATVAASSTRLEEMRGQRRALAAEADALEQALLSAHTQRRTAEGTLDRLRDELHSVEGEKHTIEVGVAGTRARREDTEREAAQRLGGAFLRELRAGRVERPSAEATTTLEESIRRLRDKLGQIGGIDEGVLSEEAEVEQRVLGLREQVRDLEKASAHLRDGIRQLDAYIHRQFTEGMQHMHEAFNTYFRQIFGGGRASLTVVKPRPIEHLLPDVPPGEGPLPEVVEETREETEGAHIHELPPGVEIRANPPGKKLTSVSQLSGGEKALTSIALLFAIISQRPSPFIVLDEVDAALDEANSRRFARMLQDLAKTAQFLVITHNRATMEVAGALYGVTMSEDGVSQLLSIRLSEVPERLGEEAQTPHGTG